MYSDHPNQSPTAPILTDLSAPCHFLPKPNSFAAYCPLLTEGIDLLPEFQISQVIDVRRGMSRKTLTKKMTHDEDIRLARARCLVLDVSHVGAQMAWGECGRQKQLWQEQQQDFADEVI